MKRPVYHVLSALTAALVGFLVSVSGTPPAHAQATYRNLVNTRFRTLSDGPQSAYIVDVAKPDDEAAVHEAVVQQMAPRLRARDNAVLPYVRAMRQKRQIAQGQTLVMPETVIIRNKGRLRLPQEGGRTRGPNDEITFSIATGAETGAFSQTNALQVRDLINLIYPELRDNVLGHPGWTGTVKIRNLDPRFGFNDEVLGALLIINGNNVEIDFPAFRTYDSAFLNMAQVIALAFHARKPIAYDAWEIGMSRAAAVVASVRLKNRLPSGQTVNGDNAFYYTPNYDLLNQPPLGNNTFFPPTKNNQPLNTVTLAGMLVPRLQMSGTAWLKCYIENPNFFKRFNTGADNGLGTGGYNGASASVANDVTALRALAAAAVPNVENAPFDDWFERQYVLDTSVIPGAKLYATATPTFPNATDAAGANIFLIYYRTFLNNGRGDEIDLSGTSNVVYWDYNFANRLNFSSFETVRIVNGFGSVAPFFANIGGTPPDQMRLTIDFPVNKEYARIQFPAGKTGTEAQPNAFSGVLVGADAGTVSVRFDGGSGAITTDVLQGAFGATGAVGQVPDGFSRTQITYTPVDGTPVVFRRNTFQRPATATGLPEIAPLFLLPVPGPTQTLAHTFPSGPQMISFPLKPLNGNLATVLGINPNQALLAQYRQDISGNDKYLRFPNLPLYQPGYGLWSNFPNTLTVNAVKGERTDIQKYTTVSLLYGWNQIATPYTNSVNVTTDLEFQYLGSEAVLLSTAVQRGWVGAGILGYLPETNYQDITTTLNNQFARNLLDPWKGYWLRVLVPEGITVTYINPNNRSARTKANETAPKTDGWRVPLLVRDEKGLLASATFGQAAQGSDNFIASLHVPAPPPLTRAPSLGVAFPHPDWNIGAGANGNDFLTDIRKLNGRSTWDVTVSVPEPEKNYTLTWQDTAKIPNGMRLTLVDKDSGSRVQMNGNAAYSFRSAANTNLRRFQIIAEPRSRTRIRIDNIAVRSSGGRAAQAMSISYQLSGSAETRVEVRLNGRIVRRLVSGRAAISGPQEMVWDTRDDAGRMLPAGAYIVEVTARTQEGEQTRAAMPVLLTR